MSQQADRDTNSRYLPKRTATALRIEANPRSIEPGIRPGRPIRAIASTAQRRKAPESSKKKRQQLILRYQPKIKRKRIKASPVATGAQRLVQPTF
jgi:hypothetical protein